MALRVKVSARAAQQTRRAAEWRFENRKAAPGATDRHVLAGDIGGTTTRLALARVAGRKVVFERRADFPSAAHGSLDEIVAQFLGNTSVAGLGAAFGVAGPVREGCAQLTNLPWRVDARVLAVRFGLSAVTLLNDLEATGYGIDALEADALCVLQEGRADPAGSGVVIAAGTGLGEAGLVREPVGWRPCPTEGGHCDFAPRDAVEVALREDLRARHGHVSWERVVSGPGLVALHEFLRAYRRGPLPALLAERLRAEDPAAVIVQAARERSDAVCVETLERFVGLYGAEAGNLALKWLATGGVYVAGGIAPKIRDLLLDGAFMQEFRAKGRHAGLMATMPVSLILDPEVNLRGAACVAARSA